MLLFVNGTSANRVRRALERRVPVEDMLLVANSNLRHASQQKSDFRACSGKAREAIELLEALWDVIVALDDAGGLDL
jgi:hypothetical protein